MENKNLRKSHLVIDYGFNLLLVSTAIVFLWFCFGTTQVFAGETYVSTTKGQGYFPLAVNGKTAPVCVSSMDYPGVLTVAGHFPTRSAGFTVHMPLL